MASVLVWWELEAYGPTSGSQLQLGVSIHYNYIILECGSSPVEADSQLGFFLIQANYVTIDSDTTHTSVYITHLTCKPKSF